MAGLSGLVGAGAQQGLEAVLERRLRELMRQQQEQQHADSLALQTRQVEGQEADRAANRENQRQIINLNELKRRDDSNKQGLELMQSDKLQMDQDAALASLPPRLRQIANLRKVGVTGISPQDLNTPEETAASAAGEFTEWQKKQDYQEGQLRSRPDKPPRTELTPGQAFSATRQLRNDYTRETATAKTVAQQIMQMRSSITQARKGDLASASQGVLVTFQKILDPISVVRESEYARSASGQSLLSRMEGAVLKLQKGGAQVPVEELQKFVDLAEQFAKNQNDFAETSRKQIEAIAKEYGLNPDNITRDFGDDAPTDASDPLGLGVLPRRKPR